MTSTAKSFAFCRQLCAQAREPVAQLSEMHVARVGLLGCGVDAAPSRRALYRRASERTGLLNQEQPDLVVSAVVESNICSSKAAKRQSIASMTRRENGPRCA